jgi:acetyl esterase/lipase
MQTRPVSKNENPLQDRFRRKNSLKGARLPTCAGHRMESHVLNNFLVTGFAALLAFVVGSSAAYAVPQTSSDRREYGDLQMQWMRAGSRIAPAEKERLVGRFLEVEKRHPGTVGGLSSLLFAATRAADTEPGRAAAAKFAKHLETADLETLDAAYYRASGMTRAVPQFAKPLLARVKAEPNHPKTGRLLACVCLAASGKEDAVPLPEFNEALDLIVAKHAADPLIYWALESFMSSAGVSSWAAPFEECIDRIVAVNKDRYVRCLAGFAKASLALAGGDDRQAEATALFEKFLKDFDGKHAYPYKDIEALYVHEARLQLHDLKFHAVGMPAPEIDGRDLDDKPMRLSDLRGGVVALSFWGSWCFPCLKFAKHEREVLDSMKGRPFNVVGVNCADEPEAAKTSAAKSGISWRSFRNEPGDRPAITKEWKVLGFPTVYLLDHHGIVRRRWVGGPTPEEFRTAVETLVQAAEAKTPLAAMKPLPAWKSIAAPAAETSSVNAKGFSDRVFKDANGVASKYVVYAPPSQVGKAKLPVILFLHGAGPQGTDGASHVRTALAGHLRKRKTELPFLCVFPQAGRGEDWHAGGKSATRGLAILDEAVRELGGDPDRVALMGVSMGGAGTWSLAAADPSRWSAIVPICHGGDAASARTLAKLPCWCFHGSADRTIPAQQSREMVAAIQAAGGKPLYTEFPGVGHDDCLDRALATDDLVEWLLQQRRPRPRQ